MKHKGSIFDFTAEREKALINLYCKFAHEAKHIVVPDICEKIANSPSPRFWVSEERAFIVVYNMMHKRRVNHVSTAKQQMFVEIYNRVCKILNDNPRISLIDAVSDVVHQPAPSFYLSSGTIMEMIKRIRRNAKKLQCSDC